jgi:ubiquinone/menaquinone biosynthesis C-methylase UbiE
LRQKNVRTTHRVQADYDENVNSYDKVRFATAGGQYVNQVEQDFVAKFIGGSRVLEVGTATGRFAVTLIRRGAEYIGVDISQKMLRATYERISRAGTVVRMDGCHLGFGSYFDYVQCIRTFHFLPKPVDALRGMFNALKPSGKCLVTFETDNLFRRFLLFFGIGTSKQYYYKTSDVEDMFLKAGFKIEGSGSVMCIPVTLYRRCPRFLLPILKRLERLWPWPMHQYVLGLRSD